MPVECDMPLDQKLPERLTKNCVFPLLLLYMTLILCVAHLALSEISF